MDLSLVPIEEIFAELDKRFDTVCVLTGRQITNDVDDLGWHYKNKIGCLGLMRLADSGILDSYIAKGKEEKNL